MESCLTTHALTVTILTPFFMKVHILTLLSSHFVCLFVFVPIKRLRYLRSTNDSWFPRFLFTIVNSINS